MHLHRGHDMRSPLRLKAASEGPKVYLHTEGMHVFKHQKNVKMKCSRRKALMKTLLL